MIRGIQHCALVVSDLERSRAFYGEALGLTEIPRPASFAFAGAWFQAGADEVHLIVEGDTTMRAGVHDHGAGLAVGLVTHLALEVDDLEGAMARVRESGARVLTDFVERPDMRCFNFLDTEGNRVELMEYKEGTDAAEPA